MNYIWQAAYCPATYPRITESTNLLCVPSYTISYPYQTTARTAHCFKSL